MGKSEATHKVFLKQLAESRHAVILIAAKFYLSGYDIIMKATKFAPKHTDAQEYSDSGDLYVLPPESKVWQRIEVKQISTPFTSADDWPYPPDWGFMVCSQHSFDKAVREMKMPHTYMILNPEATRIGVIDVDSTQEHWFVRKNVKDSKTGLPQDFYFIPTTKVRFTDV